MADGIFFDEKAMLKLGWPLDVVVAIKRVFESDAATLQLEIDANTGLITVNAINIGANTTNIGINTANIGTNAANISTNATNIGTNTTNIGINTSDITDLQDDKADKITSPTSGNLISQDGAGNIQDAGVDISDLVMIIGTGNPNTVVTSNNARQFFDTAGGVQYNNPAVGVNTGWVII